MTPQLRANDECWCGSGRKYKRCHRQSEAPVRPGRISTMRPVPADIPRPDYAETGEPLTTHGPAVASDDVIDRMRRTCRLAAEVLQQASKLAEPGVTTEEIDAWVHQASVDAGAYPSTLNYKGYKKSCCTSVNEVICHGIPDDRPLQNGDIINIDVTVFKEGVHGDTDATYAVGIVHPEYLKLMKVTEECLYKGIEAVVPGRPISEIGRAITVHAERYGYGVVRAFTGHGVGELFHNGLSIPHHYDPRYNTVMEPGMIFTIEPMIALGTWQHVMWSDGWTAVTADGRRTAQFEHTILVGDSGAEVLTTTD